MQQRTDPKDLNAPVRLSRRTWVVRWYFGGLPEREAARRAAHGTTLCEFVARVAASLCGAVGLGGLALWLLGSLVWTVLPYWRLALAVLALVGVGSGCAVGLVWLTGVGVAWVTTSPSIPAAWLRAKKARVCPRVTFTDQATEVPRGPGC